jgi:hypothetical protein
MTKRLQVLVDDAELEDIQRIARGKHMTTAEWVRQSLRTARKMETASDPGSKLESVAAAVAYSFPTGDIDELLREIERGYAGDVSQDRRP